MAAALTKLNDVILQTELRIGEETIEIDYRLSALGEDFEEWLYTEGYKRGGVYHAIEKAVSYLGILDESGTPIPPTAKALKAHKIPAQVLNAILRTIRQEASAGKINGPRSAAG